MRNGSGASLFLDSQSFPAKGAAMTDRPLFMTDDLDIALNDMSEDDRAKVASFARDGYLVIDPEIADFDRIAAHLSTLDYDGAGRIQDAWRTDADVRGLALNARILDTLQLLYGREAFPFQTLNFPVGTQQLTHSDTIHFHSMPTDFMAGVWVALEDMDEQNGPLHYYPGSHTLPHVTMDDLGVSGWKQRGYALYESHYEPGIQKVVADNGLIKRQARIRKGQALIWSANLLHGGDAILDPARSRHSQVTHYYFRNCRYWTPLYSAGDKRYYRCPYNIASGKSVTRIGELPVDGRILRRIPGLA